MANVAKALKELEALVDKDPGIPRVYKALVGCGLHRSSDSADSQSR